MYYYGDLIENKYKVIDVIAQGGTGYVYKTNCIEDNKTYAVKILEKTTEYDFDYMIRILGVQHEKCKHIRHKGIVVHKEVITGKDYCVVVTEYVEGDSLFNVLSKGPVPERIAVTWMIQLCDGLDYLHTREPAIRHGDIKPSNIICDKQGYIRLLDLDTSGEFVNSTKGNTNIGTKGYAAPELYEENSRLDEKTDIYAVGATLYELVTGEHAVDATFECQHFCVNSSVSTGVKKIIYKCTMMNPKERFQNARELKKYLKREQLKLSIKNTFVSRKEKDRELIRDVYYDDSPGKETIVIYNARAILANIGHHIDGDNEDKDIT